MAAEDIVEGSEVNGQVSIRFATAVADPENPTVAEWDDATPITYQLTTSGYTHTVTAERLTTGRFSLANALQKEGKITDEISITYVYENDLSDPISTTLDKGVTGFILERWGIENGLAGAAGQTVDVIPVEAGIGAKLAPGDSDPELTRTKNLNVIGEVHRDVKLVAA